VVSFQPQALFLAQFACSIICVSHSLLESSWSRILFPARILADENLDGRRVGSVQGTLSHTTSIIGEKRITDSRHLK
jgi:hypothetical protein